MFERKYNKVTLPIVTELIKITGKKNIIFNDVQKIEPYSHDEVKGKEYLHMPEVVVKPRNAEEIAAVVQLANRENIPVTPRGAGSGLSGGAVPVFGGILISLERMNQIIEVDQKNMIAIVEPGIITNNINLALMEYGLFFAGYPMSVESCFIGGNVAENAGGGRAVKYGVTGRYIIGLEVVTPEGYIMKLGGKCIKDVVGYDLIHLFVGSEGTLGIFTKIYIKLLPLPVTKVNLLVVFDDVKTALEIVPRILTEVKILPTSIEFLDRTSIELVCQYLNERTFSSDVGGMLLIELDGNNIIQLEKEYEVIGTMCLEFGAKEVYVADNHTTQERVWAIRRNVPEAILSKYPVKSSEDIVVPIAVIPELLPKIERIAVENNLIIPCFGHAGDGNIHSTLVKKPEMSLEKWLEVQEKVRRELYEVTITLGGTISGEHGIGSKRRQYLNMVLDPVAIDLMKRIKNTLDPNNILNPGKIFE